MCIRDSYKVILDDDYTAITLASDNVFEYKDYQPQEVKEQASNEKIAAYKDTTKAVSYTHLDVYKRQA